MTDFVAEISESDARTIYPITRRVWTGMTRTGTNVIIADSESYGTMLFLDGELQSASSDEAIYHEALVHPIMTAGGATVLVVGGGEGATVREVLRWPGVTAVNWVDYDTDLVKLCAEHLRWAPGVLDDPRVRYIGGDIGSCEVLALLPPHDVIILDLPDPDGETDYLYSPRFWKDMMGLLTPGGHIVTHVGPVQPPCVRPEMGAGLQRVLDAVGSCMRAAEIYAVVIPSFQGAWGFCCFSAAGAGTIVTDAVLPEGLRVVDRDFLCACVRPSKMWRYQFST